MTDWLSQITDEELDQQIQLARINAMNDNTLRAKSVIYNWHYKSIIIDFVNGVTVVIPVSEIKGLIDPNKDFPSMQDLQPELVSDGRDLHWENLDVDHHISILLSTILELHSSMSELGKIGGSKTSDKKAEASRQNGKKGGRPRKNK